MHGPDQPPALFHRSKSTAHWKTMSYELLLVRREPTGEPIANRVGHHAPISGTTTGSVGPFRAAKQCVISHCTAHHASQRRPRPIGSTSRNDRPQVLHTLREHRPACSTASSFRRGGALTSVGRGLRGPRARPAAPTSRITGHAPNRNAARRKQCAQTGPDSQPAPCRVEASAAHRSVKGPGCWLARRHRARVRAVAGARSPRRAPAALEPSAATP